MQKNQLPLTQENLCLILAIIGAESGFRASPRVVDFWMTPSEKFVGKLGIMKSKTSGAMEITVQDIMDREKIGYNEALEEISIIQAGIGFGIEHLKKILIFIKIFRMTIFDLSVFLLIIMLDFFTSRNTGVQIILNKIGNFALREDGLLFSQTEQAIKSYF